MRLVLKASSRMRVWPVLSGVYFVNLCIPDMSLYHGGLDDRSPLLPWPCSSLVYCRNSSTCINWVTLRRRSSMLAGGCMAKLFANGPSLSTVIKYAIATSGRSPRMPRATCPNLVMKDLRDSPFSCRMFTSATDVIWCGLLVANWAINLAFKVAKESIDSGGRRVNQLSATPSRRLGRPCNICICPS